MRIIKETVDNDRESKTFYLKSAHHDNQILTGKLNGILSNYCKLLQIKFFAYYTRVSPITALAKRYTVPCKKTHFLPLYEVK